ncbi:energy transducer TonB [Cellulophaga baltica]|uniref:energy transducer TonB n=1 Tax=Cellulophaga TaxID=104264 RepID=UPI001C07E4E9|nr:MULTISPECIES: energy transducer TonB [Cellulophaga]MBU2997181.1 energy transducer TonB [Cellulophaga baltica]MDO6768579.1 energy transducer TonB [Cellulophaga sp. 1_MG-2023]
MSLLDTKHKKKSFTLTTILLSVLLVLLFYVGLTYLDPPEENGISINFGTTDYGSGRVQPTERIRSEPLNRPITPPVQQEKIEEVVPETAASSEVAEEVVTQDNEESVVIKKQQEAKRKAEAAEKAAKAKADKIAKEKKEAQEKAQREKDAKKKKLDELMGGLNKSTGTASGSEGDDANKSGDKGSPNGNPYSTTYYGAPGSGSGGSGGYLNGRTLAGKGSVQPDCNEQGRVVVQIVVDRSGKVIKATPGVKGTTNTSPCLLKPAELTARSHTWKADANAPSQQVGFVVVNFKVRE